MIITTIFNEKVDYINGTAIVDQFYVKGLDTSKNLVQLGFYSVEDGDDGYVRAEKALELLKNAEKAGAKEFEMPSGNEIAEYFK